MESFITIITAIFYAFKVVIHLTVILCPVLPDHLFLFLFIFLQNVTMLGYKLQETSASVT